MFSARYILIPLFFLLISCSKVSTISSSLKDEVDNTLPLVHTLRALPDSGSIGFEWDIPDSVDSISGYVIYRKDSKGQFVRVAHIKDSLSTHFYDSKLEPNTKYEYAIATVGKDFRISPKSDTLTVRTSIIEPVRLLYASQIYANRIKIFWTPSKSLSVSGYEIQRLDNNSFKTIGNTDNRLAVEFFDNNLENNIQHKYRIIAKAYDGTHSSPSKAVLGATREIPKPPLNVVATKDKRYEIWLEWSTPERRDILGYKIFSSNKAYGIYKEIAFVNGTRFIDRIERDGAIRFYKVLTVDRENLQSSLAVKPTQGQTLPKPESPIIDSVRNADSIRLSWDKIATKREISYIVYRVNNQDKTITNFTDIKDTNFIDDNLPAGDYTYYVTSIDTLGIESNPSNTIDIVIDNK